MSHTSRIQHPDLITLWQDISDHDPYGHAMELLFIIAEIVWTQDPNEVPGSWEFRLGLMGVAPEDIESYEWEQIYAAFPSLIKPDDPDGKWSGALAVAVDTLVSFGGLLNRYTDILRAEGRGY